MVFKFTPLFIFSLVFADVGYHPPWGKDAELMKKTTLSTGLVKRYDPLSVSAEQIILFHQNILSPVDGPRSHFRPTSSRYMLLAIGRHGFFKGTLKGFDRLLRENNDPWVYRTVVINNKKYKWDPTF